VLAAFSLAQAGSMILSITLPIPAGCFTPIFVLGGTTGRLYAELLHRRADCGADSA
jgi:H+/Cl- antiporter ClcA